MPQSTIAGRLGVGDHSRDSAGFQYVYPVVSRRAGGVSVGINLNPNNACNWHCIYCQVPGLTRGGPPPIDLAQLTRELAAMLDAIVYGDFLELRVPVGNRRLIDIAFSGNGEPTSAPEFPEAVRLVVQAMTDRKLFPGIKLRLITNGSLLDRASVRDGIAALAAVDGEVWFKIDAGTTKGLNRINGTRAGIQTVERRLRRCGELASTWAQTCLFALDGIPPGEEELKALMDVLVVNRAAIKGVHLYGLARASCQPEAARLSALPASWLESVALRLKEKGLTVIVSP